MFIFILFSFSPNLQHPIGKSCVLYLACANPSCSRNPELLLIASTNVLLQTNLMDEKKCIFSLVDSSINVHACSKIAKLEEELRLCNNALKTLEINEEKVILKIQT